MDPNKLQRLLEARPRDRKDVAWAVHGPEGGGAASPRHNTGAWSGEVRCRGDTTSPEPA